MFTMRDGFELRRSTERTDAPRLVEAGVAAGALACEIPSEEEELRGAPNPTPNNPSTLFSPDIDPDSIPLTSAGMFPPHRYPNPADREVLYRF